MRTLRKCLSTNNVYYPFYRFFSIVSLKIKSFVRNIHSIPATFVPSIHEMINCIHCSEREHSGTKRRQMTRGRHD